MPAANFAFDGVHAFLTYPQCPLERERIRDSLNERVGITRYLVAREHHSDGSHHIHAYVHFGGRRRFTDSGAFDVDGYHPNIQKPRSASSVIAYCRKEDTTPLCSPGFGDGLSGNGGWGEILGTCSNRDAFMEEVRNRFPREYVLRLGPLLEFCEWRFGRVETTYEGRGRAEFVEPDVLKDWVESNLTTVCNHPLMPILASICLTSGGPQSPPSALRLWSDQSLSFLSELAGSGKLSGRDLLARPCISVVNSTSTTGTKAPTISSSTTSIGNSFQCGNSGWDAKSKECSQTSTAKNEQYIGENHVLSSETMTMNQILAELFPELQLTG